MKVSGGTSASDYASMQASPLYFCHEETPFGRMLLVADDRALRGVHFVEDKYISRIGDAWREQPLAPMLARTASQLREYFAGTRTQFDLDLEPDGTPFQRSVWQALLEVPFGVTWTYSALASRVGNPKACRAVGLANSRNPISIIVPCHRVIGADGSLTGYASGVDRKRSLLAFEAEFARAGSLFAVHCAP
jgi:methylated-DNA-[protein]-cysteine S-methyltransferase